MLHINFLAVSFLEQTRHFVLNAFALVLQLVVLLDRYETFLADGRVGFQPIRQRGAGERLQILVKRRFGEARGGREVIPAGTQREVADVAVVRVVTSVGRWKRELIV